MAQIKVVIEKDGSVTVSVDGVKGKKCTDITKKLEEALGNVSSKKHTEEYEQAEADTESVRNRS